MTDTLTDQMAAEVRELLAADPDAPDFIAMGAQMAARLTKVMPHVTPETIGEVALYCSSYLGVNLAKAAKTRGHELDSAAVVAISLLAVAGEQLYAGRTETSSA